METIELQCLPAGDKTYTEGGGQTS